MAINRFHKMFGGIEIAANGFIKNAVLENLSEDPTLVAGRVWYNTSDKLYKMCVEVEDADGNKTLEVRDFGTGEDLKAFITELGSTEEGHGSANVGFTGHEGANDKFSLPANNLEETLKSVTDAIDSDRKVIEDNEKAANDKIDAVQDELDNTQSGAGLKEDGSYKVNSDANYISDATSLADADNKIDAQVKTNADDIAKEVQDRTDADNALKDYLDTNFLNKTVEDVEQVIASNVRMEKDLYVKGNITFNGGTITEVSTEQMKVADNIFTLNSDVPSDTDPTENAGMEVNRGSEGVMPLLIWNEADDVVQIPTGEKDEDGNYIMANVATGGDADAIQDELDKTQSGAGLKEDGSYNVNSDANYINQATSLADADNKLDAALKSQADKEQADVDNLNAKADAIQSELDKTQEGAGLDTDGSYIANSDANYISGATSLADADNKLDSKVKENADAIAQEVSDRDAGDKAIRSDINSTRFVFEASDAATEFTVSHNLGSEMVDVMIWVYDEDEEKWFNDSTIVNIEDANSIKVTLTEAAKIRATITAVDFQF